jgi:cell filamentation protein
MRVRVLVINKSHLVQSDRGNKEEPWVTDKVTPIGNRLKPGLYNIFNASPPDRKKSYAGAIVHNDKEFLYQQCGKKFVVHSCKDFDIVPAIGSKKNIEYGSNGRAVVSELSNKQSRSRSR